MDKLTQVLGRPPRTIALFRAIKLGDLLCTVPTFRALRQVFPEAHIALVSLPWANEFVMTYQDWSDYFADRANVAGCSGRFASSGRPAG